MIYKFRLLSADEDSFNCEIEIDYELSFFEFHKIIQKVMNYDNSFLTSFYLCNNNWEKEQEISLLDMDDDSNHNFFMDSCLLKDFIIDKSERMIYIFDMLNERGFFIELIDIKEEISNKKYPVCEMLVGKIPVQILIHDNEFD